MTKNNKQRARRHVQVRVDPNTYRTLQILVAKNDTTLQELVGGMIDGMLSSDNAKDVALFTGYEDKRMARVAKFLAQAEPALRNAVMSIVGAWESQQAEGR